MDPAKGFDTFCPVLAPWLVMKLTLGPAPFVQTRVNGEARQHGSTVISFFSVRRH